MPGQPYLESIECGGERGELKHLSTLGKGKKIDFLSSGERKGKSPNRICVKPVGVAYPGLRERSWPHDGAAGQLQRRA
jgi:hypothetical protein